MIILKSLSKTIVTITILLCSVELIGQNKSDDVPIVVESDVPKDVFHCGDTISFEIRNKTQRNRGYTIEAISLSSDSSTRRIFESELYTAYFNNDTSFLRIVNDRAKSSAKGKVKYINPDIQLLMYDLNASSISTFTFVVHGKKTRSSAKLKFKIIPDIIDNEPEYIIETRPFLLYAKPF